MEPPLAAPPELEVCPPEPELLPPEPDVLPPEPLPPELELLPPEPLPPDPLPPDPLPPDPRPPDPRPPDPLPPDPFELSGLLAEQADRRNATQALAVIDARALFMALTLSRRPREPLSSGPQRVAGAPRLPWTTPAAVYPE
jgi:hypothetical protein